MSGRRNSILTIIMGVMAAITALGAATAQAQSNERWIATWATSQEAVSLMNTQSFNDKMANTTVRQVVPLSIGGTGIRLRLSNAAGMSAVRLEDVTVSIGSRETSPKTQARPLTFNGRSWIEIPAGAQVISDPLALSFGSVEDATVSFYVASHTGLPTVGTSGVVSSIAPGKVSSTAADDAKFKPLGGALFLAGVDVIAAKGVRGAVLALGDSMTAGGRGSWPGIVASRLAEGPADRTVAMLNYGVTGNRMLHGSPCYGRSAMARFTDGLLEPGLTTVVISLGGSDIRMVTLPGHKTQVEEFPEYAKAGCLANKVTELTAEGLISGYQQVTALARARGLKVFAGTILPYKGHGLWSPTKQKILDEVNTWMRTSGIFDGVLELGAACADASDPQKLGKQCDSGDTLHVNTGAGAVMGRSIDVSLLTSDAKPAAGKR